MQTHICGYHGSDKDRCLYCGEYNADEQERCEVREREVSHYVTRQADWVRRLVSAMKSARDHLPAEEYEALAEFVAGYRFDDRIRDTVAAELKKTGMEPQLGGRNARQP